MAKRGSNSQEATASTTTSLAAQTSNRKITLRIKQSQNSTRKLRDDDEKETRPKSSKRSKSSLKNKKQKIDPNKPKKPPTAFFFFLEDFRRGYQEENPEVKSMRHIGKACGEKWKVMTYEEKVKYYDIATEKRAEFDRAMEEYLKRKETGEDAESDKSESEFEIC